MKKIVILSSFLTILACSPKPQPINYGQEECNSCKMMIMSNQFAAEVVTNKSKAYKYDAIECMIHENQDNVALHLVSDYTNGTLIDAVSATYLISENVPSPMGANLSAFANKTDAEKMQQEKGGNLYNWEQLKKHFNVGEGMPTKHADSMHDMHNH